MKNLKVAPLLLVLAGCATVMRGTSEVLLIESIPAGAAVTVIPLEHTCRTPCAVTVKRSQRLLVTIEREGYEKIVADVIPGTATAGATGMAGNVLLGGPLGLGIDAMSGAAKSLQPNPLKVTLVPLPATPIVPLNEAPPLGQSR